VRLLVTGGRDFTNRTALWRALDALNPNVLIHGGALGADTLASQWVSSQHELCKLTIKEIADPCTYQEWDQFGGIAGHMRNARMLKHRPDLVLACPGGRGTSDMIHRAHDAGIPVLRLFVEV
jgi:hypothetical protein